MSNISIRVAGPEDAPALLDIYAYYVRHTAITFEYDVPSLEEFTARIRGTLEKYPYLAAVEDGVIVGYAYAGPFHPRAAYGWAAEATVWASIPTWATGWWVSLPSAAASSTAGTTWSGWKSCWGPIRFPPCLSALSHRSGPKRNSCSAAADVLLNPTSKPHTRRKAPGVGFCYYPHFS